MDCRPNRRAWISQVRLSEYPFVLKAYRLFERISIWPLNHTGWLNVLVDCEHAIQPGGLPLTPFDYGP